MFTLKASASCKHAVRPSVCYFTFGRCHSSLGDIIQECQDSGPELRMLHCRVLTNCVMIYPQPIAFEGDEVFLRKSPARAGPVDGPFCAPPLRSDRSSLPLMLARPSSEAATAAASSLPLSLRRRALRCHAAPSLPPSSLSPRPRSERREPTYALPPSLVLDEQQFVPLSLRTRKDSQRFSQVQSYALLKNPPEKRD